MILRTILKTLGLGVFALGLSLMAAAAPATLAKGQWPAEKAWEWYKKQPWIVGFNFVPSTAANTTEFWSADTFGEPTIDKELGMAARLGFNSCRVFVQYLVWKHDPDGLKKRLDKFLAIADKHGLSTVLVLFDDCSFGSPMQTEPYMGKQREPIPGMILPSWTPSPGLKEVTDKAVWPDLEKYVKDIVGSFGKDKRVLMWDLYNEPGNSNMGDQSQPLVEAAFAWARQIPHEQPLTTCWRAERLSDIISFHEYTNHAGMRTMIAKVKTYGRPVINTEWMARPLGSCWATDLPLFKEQGVGCYNWGLVNGRTQCQFAWSDKPGTPAPKVWFHDLFRQDGTPYDPAEHEVIRKVTADKTIDWAKYDYTKFLIPAFTNGAYHFSDGWTHWQGPGPKGNRLFYANEAGKTVRTTVTGSQIVLIHKVGPDCGMASVVVDGKLIARGDLDTYSATVDWNHRTTVAEGLANGPHEVVVTVACRKNEKASNTYVQIVDIEVN